MARPAVSSRFSEVRRHRRQRPRLEAPARRRAPDGCLSPAVSLRLRAHGGRQHLRGNGHTRRLPREVRGALREPAGRWRALLRRARQSRRPQPTQLSAVQHARAPVLHVHPPGQRAGGPGDRCAGLRARQHQSGRGRSRRGWPSSCSASEARWKIVVLHHPLYTSGRYGCARARLSVAARVAAGRARRRHRLLRPRAHLPAQPAAAGHSVLHYGRRRVAAARRRCGPLGRSPEASIGTSTSCSSRSPTTRCTSRRSRAAG